MLVTITVCLAFAAVGVLIGRGLRLNAALRRVRKTAEVRDVSPDALVDMSTGEVIDPDTRRYRRAASRGRVTFD